MGKELDKVEPSTLPPEQKQAFVDESEGPRQEAFRLEEVDSLSDEEVYTSGKPSSPTTLGPNLI